MFLKFLVFMAAMWMGVAAAQTPVEVERLTPEQREAAFREYVSKTLADVKPQEGSVTLPNGVARFDLPQGYRFLNATDAKKVIVDLWGNPPSNAADVLGMVLPAGEQLDNASSWAAVVTYEADGYVSDHDADEIKYDDLLKQLKESNVEANVERKAAGYPEMVLKDWAITPHYDKERKALHWAKELDSGDGVNTLNYDLRILGRKGVLSLNGVASIDRLKDVEAAAPELLKIVQFQPGYRYEEFNEKTDKKSEYSLASLVLGGAVAAKVAAKVGLFKGLWLAILAGKKFVVIGAIAAAGLVKKWIGRKSEA